MAGEPNYPGNSHNVLGAGPQKAAKMKDRPKLEAVVTTKVIQRKKPLGERFKDIFFNGEFKGATRYVIMDVILPAAKNMMVDATTEGIKRVVYGESSPSRRRFSPGMREPRFSYNRPVMHREPSAMLPGQPPIAPQGRDKPDLVFVNRDEAEKIIEQMSNVLDKYEVVSVADLYELSGLPVTNIDYIWGWTSLGYAKVLQIREGYLIDLPRPEPIN